MIKVSITKNGILTHSATFENHELAVAWLEQERANQSFGKIAGEYELSLLNDDERLTEISRRENEIGSILVQIPDQFDYVVEDISVQEQASKESEEALKYLKDTDWYIIRELDANVPCPQQIKDLRAAARLKVL